MRDKSVVLRVAVLRSLSRTTLAYFSSSHAGDSTTGERDKFLVEERLDIDCSMVDHAFCVSTQHVDGRKRGLGNHNSPWLPRSFGSKSIYLGETPGERHVTKDGIRRCGWQECTPPFSAKFRLKPIFIQTRRFAP